MLVKIEEDDIQTRKADERGRVNLGSDYGGKEVEVAILEVKDDE